MAKNPFGDTASFERAVDLLITTGNITATAEQTGTHRDTVRKYILPVATQRGFNGEEPDEGLLLAWNKISRARGVTSIIDLSDALDISPSKARGLIDSLKKQGRNIHMDGDHVYTGDPESGLSSRAPEGIINQDAYRGEPVIRFGVASDKHMGSRYERLDCAEALYDQFAERGITTVYDCGNFIDGEARFNRNDLHTHGLGNQFKYWAENHPKREGITTYVIGGDDHEGWYVQREGVDLSVLAENYARRAGRDDLVYLGYMEHTVTVPAENGETKIRLIHPGGGTAYALSYQPQKMIDSLTGGEKPQIMLIGHYHKAEYIYYRNIHTFQAGCLMDQSPFMRKKNIAAHVGGWIVEAWQAADGSIRRIRQEWISFYDKQYHQKEWEYKQYA